MTKEDKREYMRLYMQKRYKKLKAQKERERAVDEVLESLKKVLLAAA